MSSEEVMEDLKQFEHEMSWQSKGEWHRILQEKVWNEDAIQIREVTKFEDIATDKNIINAAWIEYLNRMKMLNF